MQLWKVVLTCALVVAPNAALADPVTIFFLNRSATAAVGSSTDSQSGGDAMAATATGPGAVSSATFATSVSDPLNIFGSGTALTSVTALTETSFASNELRIGFALTSPHSFSAEGSYAGQSTHPGGTDDEPTTHSNFYYALGPASGLVNGPGFPLTFEHFAAETASGFSFSGILQPGLYFFLASSQASASLVNFGSATAAHSFSLRLNEVEAAPVPEPGSLLLLGTGLAGLARVVRGRRAA